MVFEVYLYIEITTLLLILSNLYSIIKLNIYSIHNYNKKNGIKKNIFVINVTFFITIEGRNVKVRKNERKKMDV